MEGSDCSLSALCAALTLGGCTLLPGGGALLGATALTLGTALAAQGVVSGAVAINHLGKQIAKIHKGQGSGERSEEFHPPEELGEMRPPAQEILENEDVPLTPEQGLQSKKSGLFDNVKTGEHGDGQTKYLWTIDQRGINIARELTPLDTPRGHIVHTNLSPNGAYAGGEAWFQSPNEVVINAGSGRYGDRAGITEARYQAAAKVWEGLGYKVTVIPLGQR